MGQPQAARVAAEVLAAGVSGTLAGLQFALDRYGTQPFSKLVQPAIRFARDGFEVNASLAAA